MAQIINNIGIGNQVVQNDFDNMPIYKDIRQVTDSQGNVFMRIPKFYIRKDVTANKYQPIISEEQLPGFYLPFVFWDFANERELPYVDIGKYKASLSADGTKLESKTGKAPLVEKNIVEFRDLAKANGAGYQIMDIHAVDVIQTLFRVEFGTMNSQSVHPGLIGVGTAVNTGGTDAVTASSGAMGTSGAFQFKYRGIEDPWGNVYEWIDGININNLQSWVCENAEDYMSNVFAEPYKKLAYVNHNENGWVTEMGFDQNYPFAEFPIAIGGSASTYYADHYYQSTGQRVARLGGTWSNGSYAGLSFWALNASSVNANANTGARTLIKYVYLSHLLFHAPWRKLDRQEHSLVGEQFEKL